MASFYDEQILGARQQAETARKLREMALQENPQGQMISGHYVAPSWTQGLATGLRALAAAQKENAAEESVKDLQRQRAQATIQGMNQAGISAPDALLRQAETPAYEPNVLAKYLLGKEATPAQPYQQNVAQNVTPEQRDAAIMNMYGINPEMAAPMMQHEQFKLQQQQAKDLREQALADKEENRAFLAEQNRLNREQKAEEAQANRDLRVALTGNRQPTQAYGIETVNGMPVLINKVTGQYQPVQGMPKSTGEPKYDSGSDQWVYPPSAEHPAGMVTPSPGKVSASQNFNRIASEMLPTTNEKGEVVSGALGKTDTGGFMGYKAFTSPITNKNESDIFDNNLARLGTEMRKIMRIPGEGAFSDKEQAQYGLTMPSKKFNPQTNEKIMRDLIQQVTTSVYPTGVSAVAPPSLSQPTAPAATGTWSIRPKGQQ